MSNEPGLWQRILSAGTKPDDTEEERAPKVRLTLLALLFIPAALIWSIAYLALGLHRSGLIPLGYVLFSALSLAHFLVTKRYQFFAYGQCALILVLPFFMQWSMGGFVAGSAVMLWAVLSPLSALTFLGPRPAVRWFVTFALLCAVSGLVEPFLPRPEVNLPAAIRTVFFVLNVAGVCTFVFVLIEHLARMQLSAHEASERLLLNILPAPIAARLKRDASHIADGFGDVSVLFADIVGFTELSARTSPERLVSMLNEIFSRFDALAARYRLEKIKTIGDAYMVAGGIPHPRDGHLRDAAEMALGMREAVEEASRALGEPLRVRIGLHAGPVVAGVIGRQKFIYDLWGDAVNTASRMESHSLPGAIQVTEAVRARLASEYEFEDRGTITVKGKGEMTTFFLKGRLARAAGQRAAS